MTTPFRAADSERRVVITGMGVIAPNGHDLATFWKSVRNGISAADYLSRFPINDSPCRLAAEVRGFEPANYMDAKTVKRFERSLQFGVAAAYCATHDGKVDFREIDPDRTGIVEATSLSNVEAA